LYAGAHDRPQTTRMRKYQKKNYIQNEYKKDRPGKENRAPTQYKLPKEPGKKVETTKTLPRKPEEELIRRKSCSPIRHGAHHEGVPGLGE